MEISNVDSLAKPTCCQCRLFYSRNFVEASPSRSHVVRQYVWQRNSRHTVVCRRPSASVGRTIAAYNDGRASISRASDQQCINDNGASQRHGICLNCDILSGEYLGRLDVLEQVKMPLHEIHLSRATPFVNSPRFLYFQCKRQCRRLEHNTQNNRVTYNHCDTPADTRQLKDMTIGQTCPPFMGKTSPIRVTLFAYDTMHVNQDNHHPKMAKSRGMGGEIINARKK